MFANIKIYELQQFQFSHVFLMTVKKLTCQKLSDLSQIKGFANEHGLLFHSLFLRMSMQSRVNPWEGVNMLGSVFYKLVKTMEVFELSHTYSPLAATSLTHVHAGQLENMQDQLPKRSEHPMLTSRTYRVLFITIGNVIIEVNVKIGKMSLKRGKNETLINQFVCYAQITNFEPTQTFITLEVGLGDYL